MISSKKTFYKSYFILVLPLIMQQFIIVMLNIVDNIMVGKLGEEAIVAVGFSNKLFFLYLLTLFGACSGGGILISQYFGKKDIPSMQKIFFLITVISLFLGLIFFIIGNFFAYFFIDFFTQEESIKLLGEEYLKIIAISFPFFALSIVITISLRSIGLTRIPLYITIVATLINTILNYGLIYGNLGMPELKTKGAAIATLVARIIECLCFIIIIANKKYQFISNIRNYLNISKKMLKTFIKLTIPVFFTEFFWSLGTVILYGAYALLGTSAASAAIISEVLFNIGTIIFVGISNSASIIIGQNLGANKVNKSIWISNEIIKIATILSLINSLICIALIKPILSFYVLEDESAYITKLTLIVTAIVMFIKMLNWTLLVGILRTGGDAFVAFLLDFLPIVLIAIPLAFLLPFYFNISIYLLILIVNIEELIKFVIALKRLRSKKWIKNLVN